MREILFKAKIKNWRELPTEEQWVYGYYVRGFNVYEEPIHIIFDPTTMFFSHGETDGWEEIDPDTLCRYTGPTDKNGNKIWENDIVDFLGHKGKIVFECGCFGIGSKITIDWDKISDNIFPITGCNNSLKACENDNFISLWEIYWNFNEEDNCIYMIDTIGNIFDNPELLEGGGEDE